MQAVGSILAILVAVWVPWDQARRDRNRDDDRARDEFVSLLQCLQSDLTTILAHIRENVGILFEIPYENSTFRTIFPLPEDPFLIFNSLVPRLCLIKDDDLRTQIVHTYGSGKGLVLTFRYNNELIKRLEQAEEEFQSLQTEWTKARVDRYTKQLENYGLAVRESYAQVTQDADKLVTRLAAF